MKAINPLQPLFIRAAVGCLAVVLGGIPLGLSGAVQSNAPPAAAKSDATGSSGTVQSKRTAGPFRGKLVAVDQTARTITVGKRTFRIVPTTKIFKGGAPAKLEDGVVGEPCSGGFKTAADGNLVATRLTFGPKVAAAATQPKAKPTQ